MKKSLINLAQNGSSMKWKKRILRKRIKKKRDERALKEEAYTRWKNEYNDSILPTNISDQTTIEGYVANKINQGEFIGELSQVLIPVSSFSVTPFVFVHKEYPQFVKEDREVQEVLDCNLNELDTFKFKTFQNVRARKGMIINGVPGIDYEGHFIWGATALILHEFNTILKMI